MKMKVDIHAILPVHSFFVIAFDKVMQFNVLNRFFKSWGSKEFLEIMVSTKSTFELILVIKEYFVRIINS